MGIDFRPALFLSVNGIKKQVDTNSISYEEFSKRRDYSRSMTENVQRAILPFDYLKVEVDIMGKKEIINLTEMDNIRRFIQVGEQVFLREKNEKAFLDLCEKVISIKEKVVTFSRSGGNSPEENIELPLKTIQNYEKFKQEFVDWFLSNQLSIPNIPKQKQLPKKIFKNIISPFQEDLIVPISQFNTLEMNASEYLEPNEKVHIRLIGDDIETRYIKISKMQGAFLMFLVIERQEGGHMWLLKPEQHVDKLSQIKDFLDLPIKYDTAIQDQNENEITWFNDPKNRYRKSIVSKINKNLELNGPVKGNLIILKSNASQSRKGIYTLLSTIENIETNFFQNK